MNMTYQVTLELVVTYQDKVLINAGSEDEAEKKAVASARVFGLGSTRPVSKLNVKSTRPYNEKLAEFCRERDEHEI